MVDSKLVNSFLEGTSVFACGITAGATLYITMVEIPARKDESGFYKLMNWHRLFPMAAGYLKPFGMMINGLVGITMYRTGKRTWIVPCALFGLMGPFTAFFIASTNDTILALEEGKEGDEKAAVDLVNKWGNLHNVRTVLSLFGFAGAIAAMASDASNS